VSIFGCLGLTLAIADVATAGSATVKADDVPIARDIGAVKTMEQAPPGGSVLRTTAPSGRDDFPAMIEREAALYGLPPEIAEAVAHTESGFNPHVVGAAGEIGLMQILPSTARMMGFSGTLADLAVPETNIRYGVSYLAQAWRLAGRDLCTAVMKYRAGHGETRFSYLSVDYCLHVRARLRSRGFQVAGAVPVATFGSPGGGCRGRCVASSRNSGFNLAALNSKLSQIAFRVTVLKVPMR
jgi:hypothetical protein